MIGTYLWLCKVFLRMDQPNRAREVYQNSSEVFPGEISLILGIARIYDALGDAAKAIQHYKKVVFCIYEVLIRRYYFSIVPI